MIRILSMETEPGTTPFLALEYWPYQTLSGVDRINSTESLLNIISSISINLYYTCLAGIAHGDLKPDNIFIANEPETYIGKTLSYTKLGDFSLGLRKNELLEHRIGVGTIGFMAPETIDEKELSHKSDLFSLGIIAYKLTTGLHPFIQEDYDPVRINSLIKEYYPEPPEELTFSIPPELSGLIMTLLNKDTEGRPDNGFSVCRKLEKIGALYPFRKAIRPKHLLYFCKGRQVSDIFAERYFEFDDNQKEKLYDTAGDDITLLRNILEINFTAGRLIWKDGRLVFNCPVDDIIWPRKIQNYLGHSFGGLKCSEKKRAIKCAVIGNIEYALKAKIAKPADINKVVTRPMMHHLLNHLKPITIKRTANNLADSIRHIENLETATAQLYLKAGNLEKGYNIILDAANTRINEHDYKAGFNLLSGLINLCRSRNSIERLKPVLMIKADTEKHIGETTKAENTYHQIIKLYEKTPVDRLLGETYKDLGDLYKIKQDFQAGIEALEKAREIYTKLDDQLELSHTLNNIGNILVRNRDYDKAFSHYRQALRIQRRLDSISDIASTLNNMSLVYMNRGRLQRVLRLFGLSLDINKKLGNAVEIARLHNNLGCIYNELGEYNTSIDHLHEAEKLNSRIGLRKELLFNLDNLSQSMLAVGRLKESLDYIKKGIELAGELSDLPHKAFMTLTMARVLKRMGRYGQAYDCTLEAIQMGREISDENHPTACSLHLAEIYIGMNAHDKAIETINKIIQHAEEYGERRAMLTAYHQTGILKKDMSYLEKAAAIADELKLTRRKTLIQGDMLRIRSQTDPHDIPSEWLDNLVSQFHDGKPDIETAGVYNDIGLYYLATDNENKAVEYFKKCFYNASKLSLLPEKIEAAMNTGRIYLKNNDFEKSFKSYRIAMEGFKAIADDIKDENLKKGFLSNERIKILSGNIKKLHQILAKTREAGP